MSDEDKDKLELTVSEKGGAVTIIGPEASNISSQIGDLIRPFTELAGLAGDHLRIYRFDSVSKRLQRAAEIAKERGDEIKPVHPKNLMPWVENASLEDDDANLLSDMWAELLLSGSGKFDSELAIFTDILKRVGSREALVLEAMFNSNTKIPERYAHTMSSDHNRGIFETIVSTIVRDIESEDIEKFVEEMNTPATTVYTRPIYLDSGIVENGKNKFVVFDGTDSILDIAVVLEREGLAKLNTVRFSEAERHAALVYLELLPLGVKLISRCHPKTTSGKQ